MSKEFNLGDSVHVRRLTEEDLTCVALYDLYECYGYDADPEKHTGEIQRSMDYWSVQIERQGSDIEAYFAWM